MATLEPKTVIITADPTKFAVGVVQYGADSEGNVAAIGADFPNPVNVAQVGGVAVDNSEPAAVTPAPFTTPITTQVAMSTTIAPIVAADAARRRLFVSCASAMFIGPSGITATTGLLLPANILFEVPTPTAALYGITASGTPSVTVLVVKD